MPLSTAQEAAGPKEPSGSQHPPDRLLVAAAVAQLPAEDRAMLRRSFYQRWTTAQIADDMRIAETTVKTRLHFALRALRSALQEMAVDTTSRSSAAFGNALPCPWDVNLTCGPGAA